MTERQTMRQGLSHAAWGYFFLFFDLNLGTVSIFPEFVGWLLLLSAIEKLSGERRDLLLLRSLCGLLAAWNGADWLLSWLGSGANGHFLFLDLLGSAAALYFHFQFLSDMAALAERLQPEGDDLDQRLRRRRNVQVVTTTAAALALRLPERLPGDVRTALVAGLVTVGCITALLVMFGLFELRRCVPEET